MPGTRLAGVQNWCVVGPRMTDSTETRPRPTSITIVSYEHPVWKGASGLRTDQGPIAFWDA
jgi:hypothetical protein